MKISQRLYLTSLPAIVAVFLMAGLSYWGQYAHTAPELVLVAGAVAVLASGSLAWWNARYVAQRIEGLRTRAAAPEAAAGSPLMPSSGDLALVPDEIDEIEQVVHRLSSAVEIAEMNRADREKMFEQRVQDYARLLVSVSDASAANVNEARLPLHILLENHFGDLNENQEEMLGAARSAVEAIDADISMLRQVAALDLGNRPMRRDRIKPSDLVSALRPMLIAAAEATGASVEFDVAPLLPALIGDRALLHESFVTILRGFVENAKPHHAVHIGVERHGDDVRFSVQGGVAAPLSVRWAAAVRVIQAHGGSVERHDTGVGIDLPLQPVLR